MSIRRWVGFSLGLWLAAAAACTQSGQPGSESGSGTTRLEIEKPDIFWADPKVIQSCDDDLGQTTLHWNVTGISTVEVHVGTPDGPLFAMSGPVGSADTGRWVRDDMIFYLVDPATGDVLASCTVRVTSAGCPQVEPAPSAEPPPGD